MFLYGSPNDMQGGMAPFKLEQELLHQFFSRCLFEEDSPNGVLLCLQQGSELKFVSMKPLSVTHCACMIAVIRDDSAALE